MKSVYVSTALLFVALIVVSLWHGLSGIHGATISDGVTIGLGK
jgi:hypothetical protein